MTTRTAQIRANIFSNQTVYFDYEDIEMEECYVGSVETVWNKINRYFQSWSNESYYLLPPKLRRCYGLHKYETAINTITEHNQAECIGIYGDEHTFIMMNPNWFDRVIRGKRFVEFSIDIPNTIDYYF